MTAADRARREARIATLVPTGLKPRHIAIFTLVFMGPGWLLLSGLLHPDEHAMDPAEFRRGAIGAWAVPSMAFAGITDRSKLSTERWNRRERRIIPGMIPLLAPRPEDAALSEIALWHRKSRRCGPGGRP